MYKRQGRRKRPPASPGSGHSQSGLSGFAGPSAYHFVVTTHNHELLSVDLEELLELVKTAIARPSIA